MLKYINNYSKERVYALYHMMAEKPLAYEKITRIKCFEKILDTLKKDPTHIEGILTMSQVKLLLEIVDKQSRFEPIVLDDPTDFVPYFSNFSTQDDSEIVPEVVCEIMKTYVPSGNHKLLDEVQIFLKGLILTRGIVTLDDAARIYLKVRPKQTKVDIKAMIRKCYRTLSKIGYENFIENHVLCFENDLDVIVFDHFKLDYVYTYDAYMSIGTYNADLTNPVLNAFFKHLTKDNRSDFIAKNFLEKLTATIQMPYVYNQDFVMRFLAQHYSNPDKLTKAYNEVVSQLPRWEFGGAPIKVVGDKQARMLYDHYDEIRFETRPAVEVIPESVLIHKKAILSRDMQEAFYFIWHILIHEANRLYPIIPNADIPTLIDALIDEQYAKLTDIIFTDDGLITDFSLRHKHLFKPNQLDVLEGFKHAYDSKFMALRYEDEKLVVYDEKKQVCFLVSGLTKQLSVFVRKDELPKFIELRLIPLKNYMTIDSTVRAYKVSMGSGMVKLLEETAKDLPLIKDRASFFKVFKR